MMLVGDGSDGWTSCLDCFVAFLMVFFFFFGSAGGCIGADEEERGYTD